MYKTMVLELLKASAMYEALQSQRKLLEALDRYSALLKDSHESWTQQLSRQRPGSDKAQVESEAMELALREIQELMASSLPASPSSDDSLPSETASPPA